MSHPLRRNLGICLLLLATGCKTIAFSDGTALAIVGDAPAPVAEAEPRPERIELREKIQFARNSARILEESFPVLDEVVASIQEHVAIGRIRIEGHASADGNDAHNLRLSSDRAESVRQYLVEHGIDGEKLVAKGFGEEKPVADNDTPEGREQNRRVELHIVEWTS